MAVRVLYIIDSLSLGGTERQLVELIRNVDRSRVEPHLCTLKESTALYDELDIPKTCLGYRSFASYELLRNLRDLNRFIGLQGIQLVHTFFQDPFILAALAKPLGRFVLVGAFRDLGFWRTSLESLKMRASFPAFDRFIANSQAVKEHFVRNDRIDPAKIEVIYNGFDLSSMGPAAPDPSPSGDGFIVGIVANLNRPVKRVDDFIRGAALVKHSYPQSRFIVIGGGLLQMELENLASELGIRESVKFTGRIIDPLEYVRRFSIGVITSETEGFCNAIIEYMACGVPVVVTDVGGNREIVDEGTNGIRVPVGDPASLAAAICTILEDENLRGRMSANNRLKVVSGYSLKTLVEHHQAFYEKCLQKS